MLARLILLMFLAAPLMCASCNIVAPAAYLVHGPPKKNAQYKIQNRPTVVFVDDRENTLGRSELKRIIANTVSTNLMQNDVLTQTISPHDAMAYARSQETNSDLMAIDNIGNAVGAEQVIYIEMKFFELRPDGYTPRPTAVGDVKVIDVNQKTRLFPSEDSPSPAHRVQEVAREFNDDLGTSIAAARQIENVLAGEFGVRVAKVFYRHEPEELGKTLEPR